MRRCLVEHLAHVPYHGVGVERRAVLEGDAGAQLEQRFGFVGRIHRPFGGEHRHDPRAGLVIPGGQRIIQRQPGEAVAFEGLVGLAVGLRNVAGRHAYPQRLFGGGGKRQTKVHAKGRSAMQHRSIDWPKSSSTL